ncbi:MAG: hypothetical protein LBI33_12135 [Propionibacteriaceae bacterium]|nr:hypothetical protein [Propionibacteriaceae bacterium]
MILVDSSVLIKALGGQFDPPKVQLFDRPIACTAIHHTAPMLHDDRDFDRIAQHVPELTIFDAPVA